MPELLLVGESLITMDPSRRIVRDGGVLVRDGVIAEIGKAAELRLTHPDAEVLGDARSVVHPGILNGHLHLTVDRLLRSAIPDDLPPGDSIFAWAVPAHAHVTADDDEVSALLAGCDALRNGVTTVLDAGTVAHVGSVANALTTLGLHGFVGTWGWDADGVPFGGTPAEVLDRQRAVIDRWPSDDPMASVRGAVTMVGHDLVSDELLAAGVTLAAERSTLCTFHISPHGRDAESYLARTGVRPLVHFERIGALGPQVVLGHAVHLDDAEVDVVLRTGTVVASCPLAYLRLGQGFAPANRHVEIWRRGGRLLLGTDSENAGDSLDVLRAASVFAGLAKDVPMDPTAFGAHDVLELVTIKAAEALGVDRFTGSIEVGKRADLVVHDTANPAWQPMSPDPVLPLVWSAQGTTTRHVVTDGRIVVRDGRCTMVDEDELYERARIAGAGLARRAGLPVGARWPLV